MDMTADMMKAMPMQDAMSGMDMMKMQACVEACSAAMQASTMCADAMAMMDGMGRCSSMCSMTSDVTMTMMKMMMRPGGMSMNTMMPMLEACMAMCRACMDECSQHADMSETCRMCAMACEACMQACSDMMASMGA